MCAPCFLMTTLATAVLAAQAHASPAPPDAAACGRPDLAAYNRMLASWDANIRFWGKVVDQDGQPVEGVELIAEAATQRMIPTRDGGFRSWTTLRSCSGADGGFPFEGAEGFELAGFMLPAAGDEFLFTVPADGYEPTLVFRLVDPATKTWLRSGDRVPFRLGSSWIINPAIKY